MLPLLAPTDTVTLEKTTNEREIFELARPALDKILTIIGERLKPGSRSEWRYEENSYEIDWYKGKAT